MNLRLPEAFLADPQNKEGTFVNKKKKNPCIIPEKAARIRR